MLKLFCYITLLVIQISTSIILDKIIDKNLNDLKYIIKLILFYIRFLSDIMCIIYSVLLIVYCCSIVFN